MIKKLISALVILLISSNCVLAEDFHQTKTPEVIRGIQKYKEGNYIGCMQEIYPYIRKNDTNFRNQLAMYYMGMSYSKVGDANKAKLYYEITKTLNPSNTLGQYAEKGLVCINDPANCYTNIKEEDVTAKKPVFESELDKFINAPYGNGLSSNLNKELERKRVERLRKEMNSDQEINRFEFKNFKDFTNKKSEAILNKLDGLKLASNSTPTDAEIVQALKVLNAAGLNNIAKQAEVSKENQQNTLKTNSTVASEENTVKSAYKPDLTKEEYQKQIQQEMFQAQMAAMSQPNIGALFGENNNNNQNNMMMNNNMMNMLPFMMAQQAQNGNQNSNGQQFMISPDMMQAMMFNSMMPNFDFGLGNNKN